MCVCAQHILSCMLMYAAASQWSVTALLASNSRPAASQVELTLCRWWDEGVNETAINEQDVTQHVYPGRCSSKSASASLCSVSMPSSWCLIGLSISALAASAGALTCTEIAQMKHGWLIMWFSGWCINAGRDVFAFSLRCGPFHWSNSSLRKICIFPSVSPTHTLLHLHTGWCSAQSINAFRTKQNVKMKFLHRL